ncbi:hypothetical protein [Nocardia carnea]|uniref:hypothetical protein n=1 Tax=Nocardia carnea TaxID=37328 RepID=UPI0024544CF3|nr:hypothetical protein [Nocardia carnea]
MAVDGSAWFGLAVDVGVNLAVGRATRGLGPVKQALADAGGGAAGAAFADGASNGWSFNNLQAGAMGAGVSLLGSAVGQGARFGLRRAGARHDTALTEAQNVSSTASDQARRLDRAQQTLEGAEQALTTARRDLDDANRRLQDAERKLNGLSRRDPGHAEALAERNAAASAQRDAQRAFDGAESAARDARTAVANERGDHDRLQAAADSAETAMNKAQRRANIWGADGHAANWVKPGVLGAASFAHVLGGIWEYGDEGGGGAGARSVPLEWDGQAAAAAGGVAGRAPFVPTQTNPGVTVSGTQGFLLRPQELSPELIIAFGGAKDSFAATVVDIHQMSGDLEKKNELRLDPPPRMPQGITVGSGGGTTSYKEATDNVESALDDLYKSELGNKETAAKVEDISATVKDGVAAVISSHNSQAQQLTASPELEINFMKLVSQGFDELIGILETAANAMERAASGIEDPSAGDEKASQQLKDRVGALENSMKNPSLWPDGSKIGTPDPAGLDNLGVGTPNVPGTASSDLADAAKQMEDRSNDALQASTPDVPTAPTGSLGGISDPMAAAGGMGNSLLSSLLPMLMSQAAMRNGADSDLARRVEDIDPSRYDVAAAPTMPPARPASTTPWSNPATTTPAPAQPAHHQSGPPSGATSNQTGSGMPKRVPGADGLVVYPFPDGRTQKVPLTVALGLDKAFANKTATDAQAAYAGTPAAWTDPKDIGAAVDPFQLATGDVATWRASAEDEGKVPAGASAVVGTPAGGSAEGEKKSPKGEKKTGDEQSGGSTGDPEYRSALLVVFGEGESGTVEAVVHGELQQYAADMTAPDGQAFGEFAGFKHPKGIEATGDTGQEGDAAAGTGADPSALDVPALAGPA